MEVEKELKKALTSNNRSNIDRCFNSIFENYYKLCVFIAAPYVKTSDEAEDIAQDVFVNFFNSVLETKEIDIQNIKQYLCTASRNSAINFAKRNSIIKKVPFDENIIPSNDLPPNIISKDLMNVWSNLSSKEKKLISDHLFLDKTFNEIASECGESLNTIKSRYRRLISRMRKELQ